MSAPLSGDGESIFDPAVLDEVSEGDVEFVRMLIGIFVEAAAPLRAALAAAVVGRDAINIQHCTHTLKGSALALGALAFGAACRELETQARSGDLDGVDDAHARVDREYARLEPELARLQAAPAQ